MHRHTLNLSGPLRSVALDEAPLPATTAAPVTVAMSGLPASPAVDPRLDQIIDLLSHLNTAIQDLETRRRQSLWETQVAAVELAKAAAAQLLMKGIANGDYAVEAVVAEAVARLDARRPITITLHPADLDLLRQRLAADVAAALPEGCELRSDPHLRRGDCRAELADGSGVIRDAAAVLNEIHRAWLEELDAAQIERRQDDGSGRKFGRFPDRRETA